VTCGDLFAGIGGMSLGLERAGMSIAWQVECDPYCITVLERHWPDVHRRRDVRLATAANLPPCDLIAGGFPCTDISVAGKGTGITGHRSGLWVEFARIVRELQPRWLLIENVPALRRRGADTVLSDLGAAGYAAWPLVVGARHVGAPHRRDRVWIVARLGDAASQRERAEDVSNGAEHPRGPWATPRGAGAGMADASGGTLRDEQQRQPARRQGAVRDGGQAIARADGAASEGVAHGHGREGEWQSHHGDLGGASGREPDRCGGAWEDRFPARPGEPQHEWEPPRTFESRLGRGAYGISGRLGSARWRNALKALGNAVVPQVVEVIGRAILEIERREREWI
jgi:DNA (cytosine-5)-methyltransferase 1